MDSDELANDLIITEDLITLKEEEPIAPVMEAVMEEMIHCMGMEDARTVQYWNIYNDGGEECCLDQRQVGIRGRVRRRQC